MDSLSYFLQNVVGFSVGFSLLGVIEVASVAFIVYYVYTKTRAPTIIAGLFPNLNLNLNYRSSLITFNKMGNELLTSFLPSKKQREYWSQIQNAFRPDIWARLLNFFL